MKAIRVSRFGGPEVLEFTDVPDPVPAAGQVLVQVRAIGVNPVETYVRSGSNPALALPWTPGTDAAGEILAVGEGVTQWKPGDRVYTSATATGAYAEKLVAPADRVHALPATQSFETGAALNIPYATAWRALVQKAAAVRGETVLVHGGSGGVGLASIQLARHLGLHVVATAGSERGRALCREHGAHHVIDHHAPDALEQITTATGGGGADIILEMLSNVNLANDTTLVAPRGRIIVIGCRGKIEINPRELMLRDADVRGLLLFNAHVDELTAIHAGLAEGFRAGWVRPVIAKTFPLAEAAAAHVAVMEPGAHGKILLVP